MEQLITIVAWTCRKFQGLLIRCPKVIAFLPLPEMVLCARDKDVCLRLRARLLDLDMLGVEWEAGASVWTLVEHVLHVEPPTQPNTSPPTPPQLVHTADTEIKRPGSRDQLPKSI